MRQRLMKWYHTNLLHLGATRLYYTMKSVMFWPKMATEIKNFVKDCQDCKNAKPQRKYGKLPEKQEDNKPWQTHSWTSTWPHDGSNSYQYRQTLQEPVARAFEDQWLCRYPRSTQCIHDQGFEFKIRDTSANAETS